MSERIFERLGTEDRQKLLEGVIIFPPHLPTCLVAALAMLARSCDVELPDCADPECDHPRLPPDYGMRLRAGTRIAVAIKQIEDDMGLVDENPVP